MHEETLAPMHAKRFTSFLGAASFALQVGAVFWSVERVSFYEFMLTWQ